MNNPALSAEIWKIIRHYLETPDIKTCLVVCKQWYSILRFFLRYEISLVVGGFLNIRECANEIAFCPGLRPRVSSLSVFTPLSKRVERDDFCCVLKYCNNLKQLHFYSTPDPELVKMLLRSPPSLLPSINAITEPYHFSKDFYLLLYKYKHTLTTVEVSNLHLLPEWFEDLPAYASNFPNLTSLTATWTERNNNSLDFNRLLTLNPKLKKVALHDVSVKIKYTSNDTRRKVYPEVEQLVMNAIEINNTLLEVIIPQLKHLKRLYIHTGYVRAINFNHNVFTMLKNYRKYLEEAGLELEEDNGLQFEYRSIA